MSLEKVIACIRKNRNFLVTTHTNLEGDALGSELAFSRLLKKLGKRAFIINEDSLPYGYGFLPEADAARKLKRHLKHLEFDCFVILDCSDLNRCGRVYALNKKGKPVLNIDHHISNKEFGDANWIEPEASSTCEMIYKLYKKFGVSFDRYTALFLYVGMLTDTGSFRYANTSAFTHQAVAELLKYNFDVSQIYRSIYENVPFEDMQTLSKILFSMKRSCQGKIAWFKLKRNLLNKKKLSLDLSETLLSFARAVKGVEVAVLFKENLWVRNEIRVNFRSQGKIEVNKIAQFFGGGGHKTASGATVGGSINEVKNKVLAKIKENLR